jgi:hypothetical protein
MFKKIRMVALAATATVAVAAAGVGVASTASAATLGRAILMNASGPISSGRVTDLYNVGTDAACPTGTTHAGVQLHGPAGSGPLVGGVRGTWLTQWVTNGTANVPLLPTPGAPIALDLQSQAAADGALLIDGTYTFNLICANGIGGSNSLGTFDGSLTVAGANFTVNVPAAPASTTTLSVSPSSPQLTGVALTLTANVTSTAPVAGTMTFKDNATVLNATPATVTGGVATATVNTTTLGGGAHSLTAVFTPTDPSVVAASTSSAVPFQVNAPAQATTTTLASSPASPTTVDVVTLSATVSPSAAGTVTFKEGATVVATTSTNVGGVFSASLTGLSAGAHTYTADFAPANPAAFLASSSAAATVNVTAFAGASDTETITTSVAAGTLTITAGGPAVDLGQASLNSANTLLVTAPKDINPVTVTDTRAGNVGYSVSGVAGDFSTASGDKINSENLGWTPKVLVTPPTVNATAGPAVAPGNGVAVGATTGAGLKTSRVLATAAAGGSLGTAQYGATLVLQAPTSSKAGTYSTTLTLTAL